MKKIRRLISFDEEQLERVKKYAQKTGVSANFVVRDAIAEYVERHETTLEDGKTPMQRILESVEELEKEYPDIKQYEDISLNIDEIIYGK